MAGIQRRWLRVTLYTVIIVEISIILFYLLEALPPVEPGEFAPAAYAIVFGVTFLGNASILVPVYFHISLIMAAAKLWSPLLVALVASVAGTLGEISGYYAGYLGKKIAAAEDIPWYNRFARWVNRYGLVAIFLFSLQPILPVDIAGITAGAAKLPLWKFLLPCWLGRFPKYIIFCYFGLGILGSLPLP